jgi:hypothetical protein
MSLFTSLLSNKALKTGGKPLSQLAGMSEFEKYKTFLRPTPLAREPITAIKRAGIQMKRNIGNFFPSSTSNNLGDVFTMRGSNGNPTVRALGGVKGSMAYQAREQKAFDQFNKMRGYGTETKRLSDIAADPVALAQHKAEMSAINNVAPLVRQDFNEATGIIKQAG